MYEHLRNELLLDLEQKFKRSDIDQIMTALDKVAANYTITEQVTALTVLDDQDAKIQQLYAMMVMFMRSQNAILEALIEQGIGNGEIRAMHKELNEFITDQIMK